MWARIQYMAESIMGTYRPIKRAEDATHVLIPVEDYDQIRSSYGGINAELTDAKYRLLRAEKEGTELANKLQMSESKLRNLKKTSQAVIIRHDVEVALEKEVRNLRKENELLQQRIKEAQDLNSNLKRIARERANQQRGLTPKKAHDGYVVLSSRQWVEHLQDGTAAAAWKTVIQTPYEASIPLESVRSEIYEELVGRVLPDIGCTSANAEDQNGVYDGEKGPRMFRWSFSADYRAGLWSIDIYTTEAVSVPPYRRTAQQKSRKTKQKRMREQKQNVMTGEETDDFVSVFGNFGV